jgi:RNA polymerase sigma-70 factor (ECF subfamily)
VVELNRAAAVAMRDGPGAGLALIDAILAGRPRRLPPRPLRARGPLTGGWDGPAEARRAYERALEPRAAGAGAAFLERRLRELRS